MKKSIWILLFSGIFLGTSLFSQDHLLITEFVVDPTEGEFIEIYNPSPDSVDLSNYYLTDAVSYNDNKYIHIVEGNFTVGSTDFMVKFPDGTKIGPGQHITVAFSGADFLVEYGVNSDFEIKGVDAATADMDSIDVGGAAWMGLSNSGEVIILFYWDGTSDLVQDVDIVVWGDQKEAVDKTGFKIDGPDAGTDSTEYLPETPVADQFAVNADNDDDENPHDKGSSAQRLLDVEDVEQWTPMGGGNGITGHDETSENTSWKGGIWSINEPATPGTRAHGKPASDSLTIADLQFVRADSITAMAIEDSPFLGDTVTVTGLVAHKIRDLYVGNRWGFFVQDERGGPWSGFFVIQNDSTITGTGLNAAEPGDKIKMTGVVSEYLPDANTLSISQFLLQLDPVVPVEFLDVGLPLPEPILLTPGDFGGTGSSEDPRLTERWESTRVRFEGLTVESNVAGQAGNVMIAGDGTNSIAIDDYFQNLRDFLDDNLGLWPGLPPGTKINITGFARDVRTGGVSRTTINPINFAAVEASATPPLISNITRNPATVTSADAVVISAVIQDAQTAVAIAEMNYSVDGGLFQKVAMTAADSLFSGTIPAQVNNAFVEYFLMAKDDTGDSTIAPGDTSASKLFYFVRDEGLTIFDLQYTPYDIDVSAYNNTEVTVTGIVTTDSSDFSSYWIQDGRELWSGIQVYDRTNNAKLGDEVTVTGTAEEYRSKTQISNVTNFTVLSAGNVIPEPLLVNTGTIATNSPTAEQYEGMLVRVENVGVSDPFPDGSNNYGEVEVNDGSGDLRIGDAGNWNGQNDSTFALGDTLISVTGICDFSYSNFKIEPRNETDVVRKPTAVKSEDLSPYTYQLSNNYPNPFNPETTIRYQLAKQGEVKIAIFNLLGQRVRTLVDEVKPAGVHILKWNGTNDVGIRVSSGVYFYQIKSGDFLKVQKMLLLK